MLWRKQKDLGNVKDTIIENFKLRKKHLEKIMGFHQQ